ncbi:MFS transporter [Paenibacillus sp. LC-T2]|uniref:MFS transporter n=2 Tax=Paenibacillus monticola TaxID=2666075 RepID=A0A7X2H3J0_9BACL|nr:MFS transporter [Paenibacillus monticola]
MLKKNRRRTITLPHFLSGYFISRIGDSLYTFSIPLLSYQLTGSVLVMSSLFAVSVIPIILFAPFAGVIMDRFNTKYLMLFIDFTRMGLVAALPILEHYHLLAVWCLYVITLLLSLLSTAYDIAIITVIPLFSGNQLTRANAGVQTVGQLADMIGPVVAGGLTTLFSLPAILWLDVASFGAILGVLYRLPQETVHKHQEHKFFGEMAQGFRWLIRSPVNLSLSLQAAIGNFGYSAAYATLTYYLLTTLQLGTDQIGITYSLLAAGGVAGSLIIIYLDRHFERGRLIPVLLLVGTSGFMLAAFNHSWLAPGIGFALVAACNTAWSILSASIRQETVPPALLGRVLSFSRVLTRAAMPCGALLGGWMTGAIHPGSVFLLAAGAKLIEVGIALASPIRSLNKTNRG